MLGMRDSLNDEFALVLAVHRDDLVRAGLPQKFKDKIDDSTLWEIADKLSDALLDCAYWDCLTTIIQDMKLEKELSSCEDHESCDDCPKMYDCDDYEPRDDRQGED